LKTPLFACKPDRKTKNPLANFSFFAIIATMSSHTDILAALKAELVETIHFLHTQGWAPATSSNYSIRQGTADHFWISASGKDKGKFAVEDLMKVDMQGRPTEANRRPSAETLLHVLLYELYPDTGCVLHTHSVYNTVLSAVLEGEKTLPLAGYEVLKGLRGVSTHESEVAVPIFPNSQDMPALVEEIRQYHQNHPDMKGFLLAGHGLYSWGCTIAETKRYIEVFEFLMAVDYKTRLLRSR
jgi:methylthioribulose-1-phosphate dehydratase